MTHSRRQFEEIANASTLGELMDASESPTMVPVTKIYGRKGALLGVRFERTRHGNRRDRGDTEYAIVRLRLTDTGEYVLTAVGGSTAVEQLRRWRDSGELPQSIALVLRGKPHGMQWWREVSYNDSTE